MHAGPGSFFCSITLVCLAFGCHPGISFDFSQVLLISIANFLGITFWFKNLFENLWFCREIHFLLIVF